MGCLGNSKTEDQRNEEKAQREANKKIEKQLQKDKQVYRATHRLLLLGKGGPGGSGPGPGVPRGDPQGRARRARPPPRRSGARSQALWPAGPRACRGRGRPGDPGAEFGRAGTANWAWGPPARPRPLGWPHSPPSPALASRPREAYSVLGARVRVGRGRGGSRGPSDCDRVGLGTGNGPAGPGRGTRLTGVCAKTVQVLLLTRTKYDSCVPMLFSLALRVNFLKQSHWRGGLRKFPIKELLLL